MRRFVLSLLIATALMPAAAYAQEAGDSGALFLRLGMGARASGMGEAFTAVAEDATSAYWNPAAMPAVLGTRLTFMHNEFLQSIRLEQIAVTHETGIGSFGFTFTGLYMDEMDRYDDAPAAIPLGQFSVSDVAFGVSYGRYIIPNTSLGLTGKYIVENIDNARASGWALDLGVYHVSRIPGVKFAAVVQNLGSPMHFSTDFFTGQEFNLPRTAKLAASWDKRVPSIKGKILVAFDWIFPNDGASRQHLGAEYAYNKRLFLRGGFKAGYDSQGATAGLGVRVHKFVFDYAVEFTSNDLGDSHRIGFSIN